MVQSVVDGIIAPAGGFKDGGWYWNPKTQQSQQYFNGTFGAAGVINNPNQQGYGQVVSEEVQRQSNPTGKLSGNPSAQPFVPGGGMTQPNGGGGADAAAMLGSGQPAPIDINKIFTDNINSAEVTKAKTEIERIDTLLKEKEMAYNQALALQGDNPWYSEATLQGKQKKLEEAYNRERNTILAEREGYVNQYDMARGDAETKTNLSLKQYDINRQEYQDTLNKFNMLLSAGALSSASPGDLAALSTATGIPTSFMSSIISSQKKKDVSPSVLTSTDDAGNVVFTVIDQMTGDVIKQQSLGKIGKADSGGGSGEVKFGSAQYVAEARSNISQFLEGNKNSYGHVAPEVWSEAKKFYIADGVGNSEDFVKEYASLTDPNRGDFSSAYGFGITKRDDLAGMD